MAELIDCPSCGGDGYHEGDDGEGMARAYECSTCLGKEKIEPFDSKPLWDRWHAVPKDRDGLTLRLIACALRSADDCWTSTQDRSLGCSIQDENAECLRDTLKVIEEAFAMVERATIPESEWKQLGHKQHLIVSERCQFSLATHIGAFVVSTIGEWKPEEAVRKITGLKEGEFEEIGYRRKYETMVFPVDGQHECGCPKITSHAGLECDGYNDAADAQRGHLVMCRKVAAGLVSVATEGEG